MGELVVKRRKSKSPQVGDMRDRIVISQRKIGAPAIDGSAAFSQTLTEIATVWASVNTIGGHEVFNSVSTNEKRVSILFIIRYRSDVTSANIITYKDDNYKILPTENADKRNRFLYLLCALLGDDSLEANK